MPPALTRPTLPLALMLCLGLWLDGGPARAQPAPNLGATDAGSAAPPARHAARPRVKRPPPGQPITVYEARIEGGDLRVSGAVRQPGAIVVMDDDISVQADRRGYFSFRLPYRPSTCVVTLKSGEDEREAAVAQCGPEGQPGPQGAVGAQGAAGPAGEAGLKGEQGPKGEAGAKGEQGLKGESGARGEAGAAGGPGPAGPAGTVVGSALRTVRRSDCAAGCTVACEGGEALVAARCLGTGQPSYEGEGAACPSGAAGMVGFCARP